MNNRRRYDRKLLTFFSSVIDRTNGRLLGYLVDMTTGGALMKGNFPFESELSLSITHRFT